MFNVIILGITSFLTDFSSEMVYPLLPLYLTSARIGASPAIVGLIEGIAESTASLVKVFSGYFSDRIGTRKAIAIAGYSGSTLGKVLLYVSTSWQVVLVGRSVDRFGKGVRTAPRDALIVDSTDPRQRGAAFGLHRALDTLGAVVGVAVAYILFISVQENFNSIFLISIIPAAIGVAVLLLARERRPPPQPSPISQGRAQGESRWWQNLGARWRALDSRLKLFLLIVFLFNLGNSSNQFLLLRAKSLGYDDAGAILLYLAYNVVYALVSYPAGRLSDRIGRKSLLVGGYFVYGLIYFAFALTTQNFLFPLFGLYGVYIAMTEGVEKALVGDLAPKHMRATLIGLHATFTGIGLLPASALAGFLYDAVGAPAPFFLGGALGVAAAVGLALFI